MRTTLLGLCVLYGSRFATWMNDVGVTPPARLNATLRFTIDQILRLLLYSGMVISTSFVCRSIHRCDRIRATTARSSAPLVALRRKYDWKPLTESLFVE